MYKNKLTIKNINEKFKNFDVICISDHYEYNRQVLKWKCFKCNNEFERTLDCQNKSLIKCQYCSKNYCTNKKRSIENINEQLKDTGVICVSKEYIYNKKKLNWKCLKCGCEFNKSFNSQSRDLIKCRECYNKKHYDVLVKIVEKYGGKCLSKKYDTSLSKIKMMCNFGHIFYIKYFDVVSLGHWCQKCSRNNNLSEEVCRTHFEQLFNKEFKTIRLGCLRSDKGFKLELDGYCEELNLAFEHQGAHHYENNSFGKSNNRLEEVQRNDKLKLEQCKLEGINLVVIPTLFNKLSFPRLKDFIINKCREFGYNVENKEIDLSQAYMHNIYYNKFEEYKKSAEEKGGKCISSVYLGCRQKLEWECEIGHRWFAVPSSIKKGHFCPICAYKKMIETRKNNKEMRKINETKYNNTRSQ